MGWGIEATIVIAMAIVGILILPGVRARRRPHLTIRRADRELPHMTGLRPRDRDPHGRPTDQWW